MLLSPPSYYRQMCSCGMFQGLLSNYSFGYHLLGYKQGESGQKRQGGLRERPFTNREHLVRQRACV